MHITSRPHFFANRLRLVLHVLAFAGFLGLNIAGAVLTAQTKPSIQLAEGSLYPRSRQDVLAELGPDALELPDQSLSGKLLQSLIVVADQSGSSVPRIYGIARNQLAIYGTLEFFDTTEGLEKRVSELSANQATMGDIRAPDQTPARLNDALFYNQTRREFTWLCPIPMQGGNWTLFVLLSPDGTLGSKLMIYLPRIAQQAWRLIRAP